MWPLALLLSIQQLCYPKKHWKLYLKHHSYYMHYHMVNHGASLVSIKYSNKVLTLLYHEGKGCIIYCYVGFHMVALEKLVLHPWCLDLSLEELILCSLYKTFNSLSLFTIVITFEVCKISIRCVQLCHIYFIGLCVFSL